MTSRLLSQVVIMAQPSSQPSRLYGPAAFLAKPPLWASRLLSQAAFMGQPPSQSSRLYGPAAFSAKPS
ncbi:MAG: hypothetical protein LBI10_04110 [Deltaproteobacteria bacterium]|nr:hypothetical protein [Deltaproteobacteria bacterium]